MTAALAIALLVFATALTALTLWDERRARRAEQARHDAWAAHMIDTYRPKDAP